jgi:hypothetical protein
VREVQAVWQSERERCRQSGRVRERQECRQTERERGAGSLAVRVKEAGSLAVRVKEAFNCEILAMCSSFNSLFSQDNPRMSSDEN